MEKLLRLTDHLQNSPAEIIEPDYFFRNLAQARDWHDENQKLMVGRFQTLIEILKSNLNLIQVYRVGTINVDIYIVGKTASGDLAGLTTKLVEI
ncbi:nuclease A inhibitor family protein [Trichocoleus sp. FACHB-262]|nr:nuclease A inhibitor family protein [Trichocoleus sp. FACHB-262]